MPNSANQISASLSTISIVVICLNNTPEQIDRTLQSVMAQDYTYKELIIIDGGSNPETLVALKKYSTHTAYFVSEKDNGIYDAQNKGIAHSSGDWVAIMNIGDHYTANDALSKMLRAAIDKNVMMVYGNAALYVDEKLQWIEPTPPILSKTFLYHGMICHQAMLVARNAYAKVGLFDISYRILADKEWLLRFMHSGLGSLHCRHTICDWSIGGISGNLKLLAQEKKRILQEYYLPHEVAAFAAYWIIRRIIRRISLLSLAMVSSSNSQGAK